MDAPQPDAAVTLHGVAASPGVALGPILRYSHAPSTAAPAPSTDAPADPAEESRKARSALTAATAELRALAQDVSKRAGADEGEIFEAQAMMLEDPTILDRIDELLAAGQVGAGAALRQAGEEQAAELAALPDPLWQARAADVRDAIGRAIATLTPAHERPPTLAEALTRQPTPVIVVASDLAPSDTASAPPERLLGIALAQGGTTSHAAILARALGIPAVVGLGAALLDATRDGDTLALDGGAGQVIIRPDAAAQAAIRAAREASQAQRAREGALLIGWRDRSGATRDGVPVRIMANVGSVAEARAAADVGAEGIGLLRTEFLFARSDRLPSAEEQADLYTAIIEALGHTRGPVVIRTLDAGADKPLPSLSAYTNQLATEENPALGVRGLRLQLRFPELLAAQMEGIALAAARVEASVHVMLPMVATVEEVEAARKALEAARERVAQRGLTPRDIALGIMVETPAAALNAAALARHVSFFSIGSNDLTQYVMAVDRLHPDLAALRQSTQPALLRAIQQTAKAGATRHIAVAVCGEMAGEPALGPLLVGLGVTELSMAPGRILAARAALANYRAADLQAIAERAVAAETSAAVERILADLTPLADGYSGGGEG